MQVFRGHEFCVHCLVVSNHVVVETSHEFVKHPESGLRCLTAATPTNFHNIFPAMPGAVKVTTFWKMRFDGRLLSHILVCDDSALLRIQSWMQTNNKLPKLGPVHGILISKQDSKLNWIHVRISHHTIAGEESILTKCPFFSNSSFDNAEYPTFSAGTPKISLLASLRDV